MFKRSFFIGFMISNAWTITARAEAYVPKCTEESIKEVIKDMSVPADKAKKIAGDWCACFKDGAVKAGIKDDYTAVDDYSETADGKKLEKACEQKAGWL